MLNLLELEQLVAFADLGTLSKAAEKLHISQPTITRTMKRVEEEFGVPLFIRGKNRIELNETGTEAAKQARNLLDAADNARQQVQAFHDRLHTIAVESCAPAPLWTLLPLLSSRFPEKTVSSRLSEVSAIINHVSSGGCEIGILPYYTEIEGFVCIPIIRENLSVCLPYNHELASRTGLTFSELNGFNCLLRSQIGFWTEMCYQKMPASRFYVQTDEFAMKELIQKSTLPCFITNLAQDMPYVLEGRKEIPITDPEANVTYHLICRKKDSCYIAAANEMREKHSGEISLSPIRENERKH